MGGWYLSPYSNEVSKGIFREERQDKTMITANASAGKQALPQETEILIVGGGPVGLSAAIELGQRGIHCVVIEPRLVVSQLRPRAKTVSIRTMEHFRRWGLAGRLRDAAPLKVGWSQDVVFCTTLLGHEVTRFHNCFGLSTQNTDLYAETGQQVAQPLVEEVLREAAMALDTCHLGLGWSLQTLQQQEESVEATMRNEQGEDWQLRASYVIGCDGPRSIVRAAMGSQYEGASDGRPNFGLVFQAPGLAERLPHGPAVQYWILNPACPGVMGRMDLKDWWWAGINGVSAEKGQADPAALLHGLIGTKFAVKVQGTDPWTARMLLANHYRARSVFLAGDAAHLNPPWGGHGFNTGIGDAVNLGWKLAAVLQGWGGEGLLASYETERREIAEQTILEATTNMSVLAPELSNQEMGASTSSGEQARQKAARSIQTAKDREFHSLGLVLGYQYDASPVIVDDGTPTHFRGQDYQPTARPGARLPHLWLPDGTSLYDRLGREMTLLQLRDDANPGPFIEVAAAHGVPLKIVRLHTQAYAERYGAALLLVRPDQHIAWRGSSVDRATAEAVIDRVRGG